MENLGRDKFEIAVEQMNADMKDQDPLTRWKRQQQQETNSRYGLWGSLFLFVCLLIYVAVI